MPGIEMFNRRWNIASDDLFYPGLFELIGRSVWFVPQLAYYLEYQEQFFKCADLSLLHVYYVGFLCLMFAILMNQLFIVVISSRGTITNTLPRSHINQFLYLRSGLVLVEFVWSVIGTIWLAKVKWNSCSNVIYVSVLANILFCWIAIIFLLIVLFILFDPISHLPETDINTKRNILYSRLKSLFFCCYCCLYTGNSRNNNYENSYKQISSILEMIFRGGNLTPSDVLAGIILKSNKEKDQFSREYNVHKKFRNKLIQRELIPKWMNVNEAAYYVKYAVATYSWPYYIYMHSFRGCRDLYCAFKCCCVKKENLENILEETLPRNLLIHGDTKSKRHLKAFKFLCNIEECDLIYASFENELFFVPFCILVDHYKKSVVITIRGTLSLRDVITDITADCGYFDVDELTNQPCHIGMLNTAQNILNRIKDQNLLEEAFKHNPNYQLVVTGHSLGAGTAVILSLKLKKDYPNIKCIAYSPPGGLISSSLADYTKSFVMSVVVGDDIVPRLSLRSVHNLKADILKEIYHCHLPKYKIIWKYSVSFLSNPNKVNSQIEDSSSDEDDDESRDNSMLDEFDNSLNSITSSKMLISQRDQIVFKENEKKLTSAAVKSISNESKKTLQTAKELIKGSVDEAKTDSNTENSANPNKSMKAAIIAYQQVKQMMHNVYEAYPELQLPGNILYIYKIKSNLKKRNRCIELSSKLACFCCNMLGSTKVSFEYDSRWATREEFRKILITNRILMDHFPNTVEDALRYFNTTPNHLII